MNNLTIISLLLLVLAGGCTSSKVRIVRVVDPQHNRPLANKTFLFFANARFAPLARSPAPITAELDAQGEAHVRLRVVSGWARVDEGATPHGTSLKPSDIMNGGRFQLYVPPPNIDDDNIYPSSYVLEIRKP